MQHHLLLAACLAATAPLAAQDAALVPVPEDRRTGFASIDPELCREWLTYLASDELRGRATGEPGYELAAKFVAKHFAEFGLKPVGDDGTYFQDVPFTAVGADPASTWLAVLGADGRELLRITPADGLGGEITERSDNTVPVVVLEASSAADVENADLEGKAVLLFDSSERGRRGTAASAALRRARPAAAIAIDDAAARELGTRITSGRANDRVQSARFRSPNSWAVTAAAAQKLRAAIAEAGADAKLQTHADVTSRPVFAANVVGLLEGSDPELRDEIVGIGSHLDHIGARGDVINNGADDDGSGTTGVLAVARAFHENPIKPRRSILFMCFSGEERGLIGSRYYTDNPIFPNEKMVAELQMDMIGRSEEHVDGRTGEVRERAEDNLNTLHLVGTEKLSQELHELCLLQNREHVGFTFEFDEEDVFSRSDHANFARKDIPIAFFFTGFHPQYHQPEDTVDRIDFPKLARVAQLVYAIAFELGMRDAAPRRDRTWAELQGERRR